jgi:hypothetical protein
MTNKLYTLLKIGIGAMALTACVQPTKPADDAGAGGGSGSPTSGPMLVSYSTSNGTVAPPYRWDLGFSINAEGRGTLEVCSGYATSGTAGACKSETFTVPEAKLNNIRAAAIASNLNTRPAAENRDPPVGGGVTSGSVALNGDTYRLIPFTQGADAQRTETVLNAITAAIPDDVRTRLMPR